jgi:uncharacterized membrane protein
MNTRSEIKELKKEKEIEIDDACSVVSDKLEYDLYNDIHDFMTNQSAYIQSQS